MKRVTLISRLPYQRMNGVARYHMSLTAHPDPTQFGIDLRVCEWGYEWPAARWNKRFFPEKPRRKHALHRWHNEHLLPWAMQRSPADLIHIAVNGLPENWHTTNKSYLLTLHGAYSFQAHRWGQFTEGGNYTRRQLHAGMSQIIQIVAVSEWSKQELITHYDLPETLITVLHHGIDTALFRVLNDTERINVSLRRRFGLDKPYLLNVGAVKPRKNVKGLIAGFAAFKKRWRTPHKLVLAGPSVAETGDAVTMARCCHISDEVIFTGAVSDHSLVELYNGATALIFPSFYEGFGYPIVEAMACGAPVIISNTTAMPEVGGDAAHYIDDPYEVEQITAALEQVVLDDRYLADLRARGLARAKLFSWQKCAEKHFRLYQQLT